MKFFILTISIICFGQQSLAQFNFDKQVKTDIKYSENIIDEVYGITIYEPFKFRLIS